MSLTLQDIQDWFKITKKSYANEEDNTFTFQIVCLDGSCLEFVYPLHFFSMTPTALILSNDPADTVSLVPLDKIAYMTDC